MFMAMNLLRSGIVRISGLCPWAASARQPSVRAVTGRGGAPSATAKCGGHDRPSLGSANGVGVVCVGVCARLVHAFFLVAEPSATGERLATYG